MKKSETKLERVVRLRSEMDLTQDELGAALGVTGNYIYLIEAGKKNPSDKLMAKLNRLEVSKSNSGRQPDFVEETPDIRYSVAPRGLDAASTDALENLLESFVQEKDYGVVGKLADELLHRKINEKLKGTP